jgi:hypothetical protein
MTELSEARLITFNINILQLGDVLTSAMDVGCCRYVAGRRHVKAQDRATCPPSRPGPATQLTTCPLARTPRTRSSAREEVSGMRTRQPTTTKSRTEPRTEAPVSRGIRLAYEWFLGLPVQVVLLVLWVAGVVFFGARC